VKNRGTVGLVKTQDIIFVLLRLVNHHSGLNYSLCDLTTCSPEIMNVGPQFLDTLRKVYSSVANTKVASIFRPKERSGKQKHPALPNQVTAKSPRVTAVAERGEGDRPSSWRMPVKQTLKFPEKLTKHVKIPANDLQISLKDGISLP
jgi:hypothetical protein